MAPSTGGTGEGGRERSRERSSAAGPGAHGASSARAARGGARGRGGEGWAGGAAEERASSGDQDSCEGPARLLGAFLPSLTCSV